MVFGSKTVLDPDTSPSARQGFQLAPGGTTTTTAAAAATSCHRGPAQPDHAPRPPTGQCPAPDIITIEHNYCNRRAGRRAGGGGGVGAARRAPCAQRWSCGAAALRTTRPPRDRPPRAQARLEVDEAVDLVVGVQPAGGQAAAKRDAGAEPGDASRQRKEKEGLAWNGSRPSEQAESLRSECKIEAEEQPLKIHRLTPEEYKRVFSAVVGKALTNTASRPTRKCSLELARKIKEQLYNAVNRPTFKEIVHTDGRVEFVERYNTLSRKKVPPHFELDTTGEPDCEDKVTESWTEFAGKSM